ncbi:MAG TPA: hypothetical protein VF443_06290 [Nitrospira sp.]
MDLNTVFLVAGGGAVGALGLYGWLNWNKSFGTPKNLPPAVVAQAKPKRKYTKKPKAAATDLSKLQAQSQQTSQQLRPSYPPQSQGNGLDHGASNPSTPSGRADSFNEGSES